MGFPPPSRFRGFAAFTLSTVCGSTLRTRLHLFLFKITTAMLRRKRELGAADSVEGRFWSFYRRNAEAIGHGLGPVGEVVERARVSGIEVQGCDGNGAGKNGGVIGVRLDVPVDSLLEEPKIAAAARIFPFAQLVARDFSGLPREFHFALPRLGHVHVEQHL